MNARSNPPKDEMPAVLHITGASLVQELNQYELSKTNPLISSPSNNSSPIRNASFTQTYFHFSNTTAFIEMGTNGESLIPKIFSHMNGYIPNYVSRVT